MSKYTKAMRNKDKKASLSAFSSAKTSADVKLGAQALHLEYSINQGINLRDRIIQLSGDIEPPMWDILDAAFQEMRKESRKGITVKINSFGGSVYEALAIVGTMSSSGCQVTTEGYGPIMSAAALILAAGDKRRISHYAWYMWHEMSYTVEGTHKSIKDQIVQAEREQEQWALMMQEFSNKDASYWRKICEYKDFYLSPDELIDLGVADESF